MKKYLFIAISIICCQYAYAQQSQGLCNVEVNDVSKLTGLGYLVGYTVQFKNNSKKTVDGVYWNANFYNNNGDYITSEASSFNSTSLIDPIAVGFTKTIARSPRIKGASKVIVVINKVHYSDGSGCK